MCFLYIDITASACSKHNSGYSFVHLFDFRDQQETENLYGPSIDDHFDPLDDLSSIQYLDFLPPAPDQFYLSNLIRRFRFFPICSVHTTTD